MQFQNWKPSLVLLILDFSGLIRLFLFFDFCRKSPTSHSSANHYSGAYDHQDFNAVLHFEGERIGKCNEYFAGK
jgi:hypothetical protein